MDANFLLFSPSLEMTGVLGAYAVSKIRNFMRAESETYRKILAVQIKVLLYRPEIVKYWFIFTVSGGFLRRQSSRDADQIPPLTFIDIRFLIDNLSAIRDKNPSFIKMLDAYQDFLIGCRKKVKRTDNLSVFFELY